MSAIFASTQINFRTLTALTHLNEETDRKGAKVAMAKETLWRSRDFDGSFCSGGRGEPPIIVLRTFLGNPQTTIEPTHQTRQIY
eukprot:3704801-Amphidinium_carterae.1